MAIKWGQLATSVVSLAATALGGPGAGAAVQAGGQALFPPKPPANASAAPSTSAASAAMAAAGVGGAGGIAAGVGGGAFMAPQQGSTPAAIIAAQQGFRDITGPSGSVRGDEVQDTADLINFIFQGANDVWIRNEAKRRKYTKADFNSVMRSDTNVAQVKAQSGIPDGFQFAQLANLLEEALRGQRRKRGTPSIKTTVRALQYASHLASILRRAGSGIARLARPMFHKGKR